MASESQVNQLRSTQRTVEDNMSRLYEAAKVKVDERSALLSAARIEQAKQTSTPSEQWARRMSKQS